VRSLPKAVTWKRTGRDSILRVRTDSNSGCDRRPVWMNTHKTGSAGVDQV